MPKIKELRKICQFSDEAPSWRTQSLEGMLNRIFSIYITWILIKLPITPNQITFLGVFIYLGAAVLFAFNNFNLELIALGLIFFSSVLDACDGEVARYKKLKGAGVGGAYVEPVSHDVMYAFFFLPLGIGLALSTQNLLPFIAAFIATTSKLLFRLAEFRYDFMKRILKEARGETARYSIGGKTPNNIYYFLFRNLFTSTGMFLILIIAVLARHIDWFLYFYAVSFFLLWCYKMLKQWKKLKKFN